uniref:Basic leucine zipper transcription factor, ATF-like 3 n=1 Tax=Nothobranchius furzeri TaxID=105023 RepID=A0A8C6L904_NOTFU
MSHCDSYQPDQKQLCGRWDEGRRMKRREKNRVAAQKSRKRQTQRADQLHQACELLEQRNRKLRREVDSLSEEQHLLTEALRAHEPFCPIMHCSLISSNPQVENSAARSLREEDPSRHHGEQITSGCSSCVFMTSPVEDAVHQGSCSGRAGYCDGAPPSCKLTIKH